VPLAPDARELARDHRQDSPWIQPLISCERLGVWQRADEGDQRVRTLVQVLARNRAIAVHVQASDSFGQFCRIDESVLASVEPLNDFSEQFFDPGESSVWIC